MVDKIQNDILEKYRNNLKEELTLDKYKMKIEEKELNIFDSSKNKLTFYGNFEQGGILVDPGFEGEAIFYKTGTGKIGERYFYGYMNELYESKYDSLRFIFGCVRKDGYDNYILNFMKLCNTDELSPLYYYFLGDGINHHWRGVWSPLICSNELSISYGHQCEGFSDMSISLSEATYDDIKRIKGLYSKLDRTTIMNQLMEQRKCLTEEGIVSKTFSRSWKLIKDYYDDNLVLEVDRDSFDKRLVYRKQNFSKK